MKAFALGILFASFVCSSDCPGTNKKKKICVESLNDQSNGFAFPKTGLRPLKEVPHPSRDPARGGFESIALDAAHQNGVEAINSFPSLRHTVAREKYLAHQKSAAAMGPFRISDYFPPITSILHEDGPRRRANCLVAALAWFGLTDNFDLYHEDFSRLLKANFKHLKPSAAGTPILPETLVTWCGKKSDTWAAYHAAVYLGDGLVWHKLGGDAPIYTSLESVSKMYGAEGTADDRAVRRFFRLK